jgi:hypothetical protein
VQAGKRTPQASKKHAIFYVFGLKTAIMGKPATWVHCPANAHFTIFVKQLVKNTENVKDLPFLGEFRKNFSLFTSYQSFFKLLVFGSDV